MKHCALPVITECDASGIFVSCPPLQGCYREGDTYDEAFEDIKDAIRVHSD